jgi:hypothetical protein
MLLLPTCDLHKKCGGTVAERQVTELETPRLCGWWRYNNGKQTQSRCLHSWVAADFVMIEGSGCQMCMGCMKVDLWDC